MAELEDFEIFRITAEHVSSAADARQLVDIFKAATDDAFYDTLGDRLAEYFRDMIKFGSGGFQAARLKGGGKSHIVGIALFKLRFGGWRDPTWQFVATPEQTDLYESVFSVGNTKARSLVREAAGDPVITAFKDSLEANGKSFEELDEDLLGECPPRQEDASKTHLITSLGTYLHSPTIPARVWPGAGAHPTSAGARLCQQHPSHCLPSGAAA
jgi:hypothetical protein